MSNAQDTPQNAIQRTETAGLSRLTDEQRQRLRAAAAAASTVSARHTFTTYQNEECSANTRRAHQRDLQTFADHIEGVSGVRLDELYSNPAQWQEISWGLVETFKRSMLQDGYAIGTVNRRLSSVRKYAALAHKAGYLSADEMSRIRGVQGIKQSSDIDKLRRKEGTPTRRLDDTGTPLKKPDHVTVSYTAQRQLLTMHDTDTPQGKRDALLMALLLEHGLRASEAAALQTDNIDLDTGIMRVYRQKTNTTDNLQMTPLTRRRIAAYISDGLALKGEPLLRASHRSGSLLHAGLSTQAITARVQAFGKRLQEPIPNLSAHDLRHAWATRAARDDNDIVALQQSGGWSSLAMPRHYIEDSDIANEKLTLKPIVGEDEL